jgi:type II secretory pathway predicted ATPase ExeA
MYEQFYGLRDKPFSLTPNPRFVFYSQQYHEAEGQLIYGINNREGFMLVTGQPGTGKTTLCRDLIEKLDQEKSRSALIFNPFLNGMEMLAALLTEFGINVPEGGTRKELLDRLNQFLLAQLAMGKSCVAIFDEAQHLAPEFLEQIRVLSNLETDQEKLIQIILVGQPELLDKIRTPQMAQLDQRVSIRVTLTDLNEQETDRYIHHRLNVAGARGQIRFSPRSVKEIYRGSHGVPRLINLICDRALLAGYASQTRDIQPEHVLKAIAALRGEDAEVSANTAPPKKPLRWGRRAGTIAAVGALAIVTGAVAMWSRAQATPPDEALFSRATTAATAADAERDLNSFVQQFPASPHFDEALFRLARLELSSGNRTAAVQHLAQLAQHAPPGPMRNSAVVYGAQASLDAGDTTTACQTITPDLTAGVAADTNLSQRMTALSSTCAAHASTSTAAGDTTVRPDSTASKNAAAPADTAAARRAKATPPRPAATKQP